MTDKRNIKCILLAFVIIYSAISCSESSKLKFTKVKCEVYDKSVATINTCRLRAVSRYVQYVKLDIQFLNLPITSFQGDFAFMKRANGFKPFLYNFSLNCDFIKHINPVTKIVWTWFKDNTNINHSCPLTNDFHMERLENVYIQQSLEKLPIPLGDYALYTYFTFNHKTALTINFYGTIY